MNKNSNLYRFLDGKLAKSTLDTYTRVIDHFLITNPRAPYMSHAELEEHNASLLERYKPKTAKLKFSAIKLYYDYLVESGKRNDHPCKSISNRTRRGNIQVQDLFSKEELEELLNREARYELIGSRDKAIISILIYQGLTAGEIVKLKQSDIDLDAGVISVKGSSKLNGRRLEIIGKQALILDKYINNTRPKLLRIRGIDYTDSLFVGKTGEPIQIDTFKTLFRPLKYLYPDRNLNATTVRQSVIANWTNSDKLKLLEVQELAGFKYPSTVEGYRKIKAEEERKKINQYHLII